MPGHRLPRAHGQLSQLACEKGMKLLHEDGIRLIREGITTADEILRVASA